MNPRREIDAKTLEDLSVISKGYRTGGHEDGVQAILKLARRRHPQPEGKQIVTLEDGSLAVVDVTP